MADEGTTSTTDAKTDDAKKSEAKAETNGQNATDDIAQIAAKAENPDAVANALKAEREKADTASKEAKKLAAELKKYQDRDKSEQEKLEEAKAAAEKEATAARSELLRLRVASRKNLPPELAGRLQGEDEKELEQDADRLLELVKPKANGDVDAGKGEVSTGSTMNDLLRGKR